MILVNRIKELKKVLSEHNYNYYILDNPIITDSEYDSLFRELEELEKKNKHLITSDSPTQRVGTKPNSKFDVIQHRKPMLSLANAMTTDELVKFNNRIKNLLNISSVEYIAEPKLDGLGVEIVYENGTLIKASTRGDGYVGEDITQNLKTIRSVPLKLRNSDKKVPSLLEVRGEVFIKKDAFQKMNIEQKNNSKALFVNPRNAAAGSLRQLDPAKTATRPLSIYLYDSGVVEGLTFKNHIAFLEALKLWGLPTNSLSEKISSSKGLIEYHKKLEGKRNTLPYEIDGTVFKVNDYLFRDKIGSRSRSPRWAIAGKFKSQQAMTIIKSITIQVGRTGALTPVANLEPVFVGGVTVTNATLHNQAEINKKDIRIGDTVIVERAGDVIPKIIKSIPEKRLLESISFKIPQICPICLTKASFSKDQAVLRCPNSSCPSQIKGRIQHFCSRNAMNIDGLGEKIINQLVEKSIIISVSDIYSITKDQLLTLDGFGSKSAENLLESIKKSKRTSFSKFIYALGIRNVGEHISKLLEDYFNGSLEDFMMCSDYELESIDGVGIIVSHNIIRFWKDINNIKIVKSCIASGVELRYKKSKRNNLLSDKNFVFTGSLKNLKRSEVKEIIQSVGSTFSSNISKKTDFLVAGPGAGSKLEKAKNLNIKIISELEFLNMMGKNEN